MEQGKAIVRRAKLAVEQYMNKAFDWDGFFCNCQHFAEFIWNGEKGESYEAKKLATLFGSVVGGAVGASVGGAVGCSVGGPAGGVAGSVKGGAIGSGSGSVVGYFSTSGGKSFNGPKSEEKSPSSFQNNLRDLAA